MGQEERKNKAKMEKTQIQLATTSNEYEAAVKILEETTGRWNRDWKAACDVRIVVLSRVGAANGHRNFKILRRRDLTLRRAVCGPSRTLHRLSVLAMMLSVLIRSRFEALLTFSSRARRYGFHLKDARSKRTSLASFKREGPGKRFLILQSISTSVVETSMTMLRMPQKTIIQSPSSRGPSILLSAVLLLNRRRSNPITIHSQIWPDGWATLRPIHLLVERRP